MRQIWTSRKVWLPILLLFTAVLIFACWDRGVAIDFDGTGLYHASPLDSAIETVPVSFHGQLRKNVYTGSCDIPGVLQCDDLCVIFRGDESTDVYCRDQAYSEPTPIHSITLTGHSAAPRSACGANIPWRETASSPPLTPSCTPPSPSLSETVPHNAPHPPAHAGGCGFSVVHLLPRRLNHQKVSGHTHPANSTTSR